MAGYPILDGKGAGARFGGGIAGAEKYLARFRGLRKLHFITRATESELRSSPVKAKKAAFEAHCKALRMSEDDEEAATHLAAAQGALNALKAAGFAEGAKATSCGLSTGWAARALPTPSEMPH